MEVSLDVKYCIENINYKVVYGNIYNKKKSVSETDEIIINENYTYLIFLQIKKDQILANLYNLTDNKIIKKIFKTYKACFEWTTENIKQNHWYIVQNLRKEMEIIQEEYPSDLVPFRKMNVLCLESFLKYDLKLPIFVQGKIINNKYRIPTITEYLETTKMEPLPPSDDLMNASFFVSKIKTKLFKTISIFNRNIRTHVYLKDRQKIESLIYYFGMHGYETSKFISVFPVFANKKIEDNNWNHDKFPMDFYTIEQIKKQINQGKRTKFSVVILNECYYDYFTKNDTCIILTGPKNLLEENGQKFEVPNL